jgi:hypothetical protein
MGDRLGIPGVLEFFFFHLFLEFLNKNLNSNKNFGKDIKIIIMRIFFPKNSCFAHPLF